MTILVRPSGPIPARIMLVGDVPGERDEVGGAPFLGPPGDELSRMLETAKVNRNECFITNVVRERPLNNDLYQFIAKARKDVTSDHRPFHDKWVRRPVIEGIDLLKREIEFVKPNVIIAFGNLPLWVLTGHWGIGDWRGSMLNETLTTSSIKVIPTYHPTGVLRQWAWRPAIISDLRRAKRFADGTAYPKPDWNFVVRPTIQQVLDKLQELVARLDNQETFRLSFDIETRHGHIACIGLSWNRRDALCIPFMAVGKWWGYWDEESETTIIWWLRRLLTHKNVQIVGQNLLYDAQYTWRHWHFVPHVTQDTMIAQHSIFSAQEKGLAYIASIYCDYYVYWKDESKGWNGNNEDQLWRYNCQDCVYTEEAGEKLIKWAGELGLGEVYLQQQKMFWPVLQAMQRGVKIDIDRRTLLQAEVSEQMLQRQQFLDSVIGHKFNQASPKQMMKLFYDDLRQPVQYTRATKGIPARPTLNDEALQKLSKREPLLKPLVNAICDIRTLKIFMDFLTTELDIDNRMRCSFNIGGSASGASAPKTYRLSSSENAFGSGGNLQVIPSDKSKSIGKALQRGVIAMLGDPLSLPNIRTSFIPDTDYDWFDGDLDRADLQVVVWETGDEMLKAALRMGVDIHLMNAFILIQREPPPLEELVETHPRYAGHRGPMKTPREFAKVFCHGTNYGGKAPTMAAHTGRTVHEVDRAQKLWFGAHPGISKWHGRIEAQVKSKRYVENRFGYRWYIFDRLDAILPEAIAWIPQSTVSNVINRIWLNIYENLPEVQVLLQVHDSLGGQLPRARKDELLPKIKEQARIVIPYEDPLVIPFGIKTSEISWGDVH